LSLTKPHSNFFAASSENGQKGGEIIYKDGKVRQVIVRHISMAKDEEELKHFIRLAEFIRAEVENEHQMSLFSPELAY
jgi:ubiquinone/menaquinone biosynthesis C-methylase UbiE